MQSVLGFVHCHNRSFLFDIADLQGRSRWLSRLHACTPSWLTESHDDECAT